MKISNLAALVAVSALAATGLSQGRPGMGGGRGPRSPQETADRQTQMMTQALGLNAAQQKQLHAIIFKSAVDAQHRREAQRAAIMKMLSADQRRKFDAMGPGMGRGGPGGPGMGRPGMGGPGGMRRGG